MPFSHGRNTLLLLDSVNISSWFRNTTITGSTDLIDTTTYSAAYRTFMTSFPGASMALEGLYDGDTNLIDSILNTAVGDGLQRLLFASLTGATAVGTRLKLMQVRDSSYQIGSPVADAVTINADFQGDPGALDQGISLRDITAGTGFTTGNGTSHDNGAASANGGVVQIHILSNTLNAGNVTFRLEDSADNAAWATVAGGTFSAVAAAVLSAQRITFAPGSAIRRYTRIAWTMGGGPASGTVLFAAAVARR